jgi:hypothetical protein
MVVQFKQQVKQPAAQPDLCQFAIHKILSHAVQLNDLDIVRPHNLSNPTFIIEK